MRVTQRSNPSILRPSRRHLFVTALSGTALAGMPSLAQQPLRIEPHVRAHDWEWLVGNWEVQNRRLRQRLARSTQWDEFNSKSAVWLTMGGLGTIDDNILELPSGLYRATGIRAYDPATDRWSIWWLDGRNPTRIDPPVTGRFDGDTGTFTGADTLQGRPIVVRFHWQDICGKRPHWQQSFSPDEGQTWEMNWENFFTRTAPAPQPFPLLPPDDVHRAPDDWAFLVGQWTVHHRKLRRCLASNLDWDEFGGTFVNWPILGGQGNVGDNTMAAPAGTYRGVGLRAFDPATRQWLSWWLDGRKPAQIGEPLRGRFKDGIGTFLSEDTHEGRPIKVRATWSGITPTSARWEQSFSADGGQHWEINWTSDYTRVA
jgi:hypothetical protein